MKLKTLALRTLVALAILFAIYVGYDGGRGQPTVTDAHDRTLGPWSGECQNTRAGTPVFHAPSQWAVEVGMDEGIEAAEVVTLKPVAEPGGLPTVLRKTPLYRRGDKSLARPKECDEPGDYAITFTGQGKWTARVRY